jgi:amidase
MGMHRIGRDLRTYYFDPRNRPVAGAHVGDTVVFETVDCFDGQIETERDLVDTIDMSHVNPTTGPLEVYGAVPGHVLAVKVLAIEAVGNAIAALIPGVGVLKDFAPGPFTRVCPIIAGKTVFSADTTIESRLMVGTIGTTPEERVPTGLPGDHGGNMDVPLVGVGATIYLPVFTPGALFQMGDVHSAMGDGECSVTGMECSAEVTVRIVDLVEGRFLPGPLVETADAWGIVASARVFDDAMRVAVRRAAGFLARRLALTPEDAAILLSVSCNARIAQWADANYDTVIYVEVPKHLDRKGRLRAF